MKKKKVGIGLHQRKTCFMFNVSYFRTAPDKQLHLNKYTEVNNGKSHGSSCSQHKKKQTKTKQKQNPITLVRRLWAPVVV